MLNSDLLPLGRSPQYLRASPARCKFGTPAPMHGMLPESRRNSQRQRPRRSARIAWQHALACVPPDRCCNRPSRRATAVELDPCVRTCPSRSHVPPFPSARKLLAGARRRLLGELAPGRRDARRLLSARDRSEILTAERNGQWPWALSGAVVRESKRVDGGHGWCARNRANHVELHQSR